MNPHRSTSFARVLGLWLTACLLAVGLSVVAQPSPANATASADEGGELSQPHG